MTVTDHPRAELPGLLLGELTAVEEAAVDQHLLRCDACRQDLVALTMATSALRGAAQETGPVVAAAPDPAWPAAGGTVLAVTDDGRDPAYAATRFAAFDLARELRARVVLFDCSPMLYLVDPYARYASGWEPERDLTAGLVDEYGSLRLGRTYLAQWLREAEALGLTGRVWVAGGDGLAALVGCARTVAAQQVLLPARCARPSLIDRIRGHTLANLRQAMDLPVILVEEDGRRAEA